MTARRDLEDSALSKAECAVPAKAIDAVSDVLKQRGGDYMVGKYPQAMGLMYVSHPGFDAEGNQALVIVGFDCGYLAGGGDYVLLEKKGETWSVTEVSNAWVS